jgi:hypothetical protein
MSVQVPRRLYGWPAVAAPVQSRERERGRHSVRPVQFSTTMNTQVKNAVILAMWSTKALVWSSTFRLLVVGRQAKA